MVTSFAEQFILRAILGIILIIFSSANSNINKHEGLEKSGKRIYEEQCSMCHGQQGETMVSDHNLQGSDMGKEEIKRIVREGRGGMPDFEGQLSEEEIKAVSAYVKQLRK